MQSIRKYISDSLGIGNFASEFVYGFLAIIVGFVVAYLLRLLAKNSVLLIPTKFQNTFIGKLLSSKQISTLASWVGRIAFSLTIVLFFAIASELFGLNILTVWVRDIATYIPNVLAATIIAVTGTILAKIFRQIAKKSMDNVGVKGSNSLGIIVYAATLTVTSLVAVKQVGIEIQFITSVILVLLSGLVLAGAISFGLGSATVVSNILSTYYVKQFLKSGDHIVFEEAKGQVVKYTATAMIISSDGKLIVIPSKTLNEKIIQVEG